MSEPVVSGTEAFSTTWTDKNAEVRASSVDKSAPIARRSRGNLTIASSQLATPPLEIPGVEDFAPAIDLHGQPALGLIGD